MLNSRFFKKTRMLAGLTFALLLSTAPRAWAEKSDKGDKGKKEEKPGPAKKMKILEVFPSKRYTIVAIKFYDAKGKVTAVKAGTFSWWSNFLKDRRKPAKKRRIDLAKVHYRKEKYTLKLVGYKRLCPPRTARLRVTFKGTEPRRRFRSTWKKRAKCR